MGQGLTCWAAGGGEGGKGHVFAPSEVYAQAHRQLEDSVRLQKVQRKRNISKYLPSLLLMNNYIDVFGWICTE